MAARLSLGRVTLYLKGENLTDRRFHAFYFKSRGNEFFALGKPRRLSLGIDFKF